MADDRYTQELIGRVAEVATAAVAAREAGRSVWNPAYPKYSKGQELTFVPAHSQYFDLVTPAMCMRFVRQCFEVGCGWPAFSWKYRAPRAKYSLAELDQGGHAIWRGNDASHIDMSTLRIGDIVGKSSGTWGHIMVVVGRRDGVVLVAENTSGRRGAPHDPGTKITPLPDALSGVTSVHRLLGKGYWDDTPPAPDTEWEREIRAAVEWAREHDPQIASGERLDENVRMDRLLVVLRRALDNG